MSIQDDIWTYRIETGDLPWEPTSSATTSRRSTGASARSTRHPTRSGRARSSSTQAPWIFGKKVVLPAGVIDRVDAEEETVYVRRTKDQIKDAPRLDEGTPADDTNRDEVAGYYGPGGAGWHDDRRA